MDPSPTAWWRLRRGMGSAQYSWGTIMLSGTGLRR